MFADEIISLRETLLPEYEAWQKKLAEIEAWRKEYEKEQKERYSKFPHPLVGMNSSYINYTKLGPAYEKVYLGPGDRELELWETEKRTGRTKYKWKERNFYAITEMGAVVDIERDGSFGGKVPKYYGQDGDDFHYIPFSSGGYSGGYNAGSYSNPEDFYDDYYDDFESYEDAEDTWNEYND